MVDTHGVLTEFFMQGGHSVQVVMVARIKARSMPALVLPGLSLFKLLA